jgi:hypothetical protein
MSRPTWRNPNDDRAGVIASLLPTLVELGIATEEEGGDRDAGGAPARRGGRPRGHRDGAAADQRLGPQTRGRAGRFGGLVTASPALTPATAITHRRQPLVDEVCTDRALPRS